MVPRKRYEIARGKYRALGPFEGALGGAQNENGRAYSRSRLSEISGERAQDGSALVARQKWDDLSTGLHNDGTPERYFDIWSPRVELWEFASSSKR
jgi:hypothetical protein